MPIREKKYYGNPQYEMRDENWSVHECFKSALQAMQWKDEQHAKEKQQWIEKAAEWFGNYLFEIGYPDDWLRDSPNIKNGKTRFIQAMIGEQYL